MAESIRIGCGAGFWGDSPEGPRQLVESGGIDYLMLDYLAEITMSLLARAREKNPQAGYATDFPAVIAGLAPQIKAQGIRVVANAAGVNPQACRDDLAARLEKQGVSLKIAVVTGDDLLGRTGELREVREMFSGAAFPDKPWSANAYLGAFPIAAALSAGADVVITGRCVDSALALGPLIHEFGWTAGDYDRLAGGSLAGHVIECGVQGTGGIVTDWKSVVDDWDNMGFPIAECRPDGSFDLTKPTGTGGRITPATTAEQIVYEIGDPKRYLLPDVTCDFSGVQLAQAGEDRVRVTGARGGVPTDSYKVSATYQDGFRATGTMMIGGPGAVDRAEHVAAAILKRTRRLFERQGLPDYRRTDVEVLGAEANWGGHARARGTREVILKVAVHHEQRDALQIFAREFLPSATSMAQGITGFAGGRPPVRPLLRLFSCLVPKSMIETAVHLDGEPVELPPPGPVLTAAAGEADAVAGPLPDADAPRRTVPLIEIAYGRSGDKGDSANIGILARRPEWVPVLREQVTADAVRGWLSHFVQGEAQRFEWPGLGGFNFLLTQALGGGGMASLRHDPQGKMLAQILMDLPVAVPVDLLPGSAEAGSA